MDRQKILLFSVGFLLVLRFIAVPLSEQRSQLYEEILTKQQRLDKGQALLANAEAIQIHSEALKSQLNIVKRQFPSGPNAQNVKLSLQRNLSTMAAENNLTVESLEWFDGPSTELGYTALELRVVGDFKGFAQFNLALLEQKGLIINSIKTNVRDQKVAWRRLGTVSSTLQLDVYYLVNSSENNNV